MPKVITPQKVSRMSQSEVNEVYRKELRNYKDNIRKAERRLGVDLGTRNFPTLSEFKQASPGRKAQIIGTLTSYRSELGTASTIVKRYKSTERALRDPGRGYGSYFENEDNEIDYDRFGRFMKAARAAWAGGRRTFDSGAAVSLFGIMEENHYSVRMFQENMSELLSAVAEGIINEDNADAWSGSRNVMERTAKAFEEWGIG